MTADPLTRPAGAAPPARNRRRARRWFAANGLFLLLAVYAFAVSGYAVWQMRTAVELKDELAGVYIEDLYHKESGYKYRLASLDDVRLNALTMCVEYHRRELDIGVWPVEELYDQFQSCQEQLSRAR